MSKPLVTFIKFLAPFPRTSGESNDASGSALVHQISEQLSDAGITVIEVKRTGDWKWQISARKGCLDISTLIGANEDFMPGPVNQWMAMHNSNLRPPLGLVPYFALKSRHINDHEKYCSEFYETISSSDGLGNVTWYNTTSMGIRVAESNID